jgi:hypothetical protein
MKTIAETFLELAGSQASRTEREFRDAARLCDATRDAYLAQPDLPQADRMFAPRLFDALRALVLPATVPAVITQPARDHLPARGAAGRTFPTLLTAGPILSAVLVASILLGTSSLSIVLAIALGVLGWFGAGGSILGLSSGRLRIDTTPAPLLRIEGPRAVTRTPDLTRLEDAFRQADVLLTRLREAQPSTRTPVADTAVDQAYVQFLQDLAEAGAAQDGEHLTKLVTRRLPSVLRVQGLRLAMFGEAPAECFVLDEIAELGRRGTTVTMRPAILRGDDCVTRGYARRYV